MAEIVNLQRRVPQWMIENYNLKKRLDDSNLEERLETASLEKRLGDLERRHDRTRKLLSEALSLAVVISACLLFKPESAMTTLAVVWGAMAVTSGLVKWFLKD